MVSEILSMIAWGWARGRRGNFKRAVKLIEVD